MVGKSKNNLMKQGIEKVLEEFDEIVSTSTSAFGLSAGQINVALTVRPWLRSAIETAFKEVSTADFSRQTARIFKNEAHQRGYIAALSDYDKAVDKFLGK